jgi:hypothetical protein
VSRIDGDSAEAVAWTLLVAVAKAEGIDLDKEKAGWPKHKILPPTGSAWRRSEAATGEKGSHLNLQMSYRRRLDANCRPIGLQAAPVGPAN